MLGEYREDVVLPIQYLHISKTALLNMLILSGEYMAIGLALYIAKEQLIYYNKLMV